MSKFIVTRHEIPCALINGLLIQSLYAPERFESKEEAQEQIKTTMRHIAKKGGVVSNPDDPTDIHSGFKVIEVPE